MGLIGLKPIYVLYRPGYAEPFYYHSTLEGVEAMARFEVREGRDVIIGHTKPQRGKEHKCRTTEHTLATR